MSYLREHPKVRLALLLAAVYALGVLSAIMLTGLMDKPTDINRDGHVDVRDLNLLLKDYGER